jgi:hypothetical protein
MIAGVEQKSVLYILQETKLLWALPGVYLIYEYTPLFPLIPTPQYGVWKKTNTCLCHAGF